MRFGNMFMDSPTNGGIHPHSKHIFQEPRLTCRRSTHEIHHAFKILIEENFFTQSKHAPAVRKKFSPALTNALTWKLQIHCRRHCIDAIAKIDDRSIIKETAPLWIKSHQIQIIGHCTTTSNDDSSDNLRKRQDGRSHIEPKSRFFKNIHLAAEMCILFDHRDRESVSCQFDSGCKPCKSCTNNKSSRMVRLRRVIRHSRRFFLSPPRIARKMRCDLRSGSPVGIRIHLLVFDTVTLRVNSSNPDSPRVAPHPLSPVPRIDALGCAVGINESLKVTKPARSCPMK